MIKEEVTLFLSITSQVRPPWAVALEPLLIPGSFTFSTFAPDKRLVLHQRICYNGQKDVGAKGIVRISHCSLLILSLGRLEEEEIMASQQKISSCK